MKMARQEDYGNIPSFKSMLTGCDNWATIIDEYGPYKSDSGIWMKKYKVVPTEHLIKDYPWLLEEGKMVRTKYGLVIWVEYPYAMINDKNTSRTNAIVRVDCAFDGGKTSETERHKYDTDRIMDLQRECNLHQESGVYYMEMCKTALSTAKELATYLAELQEIMSKGKKKEDEDEEEQNT